MDRIAMAQGFAGRIRRLYVVLDFITNVSTGIEVTQSHTVFVALVTLCVSSGGSIGCDHIPSNAYGILGCTTAKNPVVCAKKAVCLRAAAMA